MSANFSVKVLFITSVPIITAFLFGIFFKSFINSAHLGIFLATVAAGLVFLATLIVFSMLESNRTISLLSFSLASAGMAAPFFMSMSVILLAGILTSFTLFAVS